MKGKRGSRRGGLRLVGIRKFAAAPVRPDRDDPDVAIGIAGSGRVGTIALQECDRRPAGAVGRSRSARAARSPPGARSAQPDPRDCASGGVGCRISIALLAGVKPSAALNVKLPGGGADALGAAHRSGRTRERAQQAVPDQLHHPSRANNGGSRLAAVDVASDFGRGESAHEKRLRRPLECRHRAARVARVQG
jgi:hypothetical protein